MSNKKIYSYIDRKMIDPYDNSVNFKQKENSSSFTVGDLLKRIIFLGIIVFIVIRVFSSNSLLPNSSFLSHKNSASGSTKIFLDTVSDVSFNSNDILTKLVTQYNSNNFSESYKEELRRDLENLQKHSLDKYKQSEFSTIKKNTNQILTETQDCVKLILYADKADNKTSQILNSKTTSINNNIKYNWDLIIQYFKDNNIDYEIDDANNKIHYHITY
ncbi:RNA-dependent RNA polymerase [Clostridium butyricum]|uniref:RNA-dependent RNA polymerase n=1 Tax=Clostridium butyricum TaxID=1492 RepID=UPI0029084B13|nr:RNA-dependent RNA polymerase [Clostridium butyricum]MDU6037438.1 RNA-dependent RNA polymerase [Clostridium butyricum]